LTTPRHDAVEDTHVGAKKRFVDDVDTVIVDGKVVMEGGIIPGVDFSKLRDDAQSAAEQIWGTLQESDPLGRTHEDACPWCYPIAQ
jgi:5-methylthioadenosine/S-adenosylhomocysteine deaminase